MSALDRRSACCRFMSLIGTFRREVPFLAALSVGQRRSFTAGKAKD
jgi:hypothetical protein